MSIFHYKSAISGFALLAAISWVSCVQTPPNEGANASNTDNSGTNSGSINIPNSDTGGPLETSEAPSNFGAAQLALQPIGMVPVQDSPNLGLSDFDDVREVKTSNNPAQEPVARVNQLLCLLQLAQPGLVANQGPVLVAGNFDSKCFGDSESQSLSSATVHATKAMDSDLNFDFYLRTASIFSESTTNVYVRGSIQEAASNSNPFGVFTLSYQGFDAPFATTSLPFGIESQIANLSGYLKASKIPGSNSSFPKVVIEFFEKSSPVNGYKNRKTTTTSRSARIELTLAAASASHGKLFEKSLAKVETQVVITPFGAQSVSGGQVNSPTVNPREIYSMAFDASEGRVRTKMRMINGDCSSLNGFTCALAEGSPCSDANVDGKCDEDQTKWFCPLTAGSPLGFGPCCKFV